MPSFRQSSSPATINAKVTDSASLDELIAKLKGELPQARADY
jgi:hypothetical protein